MSQPIDAMFADRRTIAVLLGAVLVGLLTQRLGVWAGELPLPVALVLLPLVGVWLAAEGAARIHPARAICFLAMALVAAISTALNLERVSLPSVSLLLLMYAPLCLQAPLSRPAYRAYIAGVVGLAAAFAAAGVAQYLLQYLVSPKEPLFTWAGVVPDGFLIEYATINRLNYYSEILKSNGGVFLEPSAFSQFLARVVLLSLIVSVRKVWLPLLGVAMLLSYSGSGLILLALFAPFALLTREAWEGFRLQHGVLLAVAAIGVLALAAPAMDALDLNLLFNRWGEFTVPGSSGYARYGSTPLVLGSAFAENPSGLAFVFGLGPGQTDRFLTGYPFEVFATTWVKLLIEYGLAGLAAMLLFVGVCFWTATRSAVLTAAFLFQLFVLDANLLVPQQVLLMALLAVLPARAPETVEAAEPVMLADDGHLQTAG